MLEFAAILGEAIARVHLARKLAETRNANVPVDGRDVCVNVPFEKEDWNSAYNITVQPLRWLPRHARRAVDSPTR